MVAPMAIAAGLGMLGQSVASGINAFRGPDNKYLGKQVAAADLQKLLAQASADPSSEANQNLTGYLEQRMQQDAARSVMEDLMRRRRSIAAGNVTQGVASNRRDEAISGSLAQAFQDAGVKARDEAGRRLLGAAGQVGYSGMQFGQAQGVRQNQRDTQMANQYQFAGQAPFALAHMYQQFAPLFQGGGGMPYNNANQTAQAGKIR